MYLYLYVLIDYCC